MNMLFEEIVATEILNRFKNLREVQRSEQFETITATFTEREIKEVIYIMGDYLNIINKFRKE